VEMILAFIGNSYDMELSHITDSGAVSYLDNLPSYDGVDMYKFFSNTSPDIVTLLKGMLIFEPKNRIDPEVALQMDMFDDLRDEALEELSNIDHELDISIVEDVTMDPTNFRHIIFDELSPYLLRGGLIDPEEMFSDLGSMFHNSELSSSASRTRSKDNTTESKDDTNFTTLFQEGTGVISGELTTLKSNNKLIKVYKKFRNPIISPMTRQLSGGYSSRTLSTQKTSFKRNHIDSVDEDEEKGGGGETYNISGEKRQRKKKKKSSNSSFMGFLPSIK